MQKVRFRPHIQDIALLNADALWSMFQELEINTHWKIFIFGSAEGHKEAEKRWCDAAVSLWVKVKIKNEISDNREHNEVKQSNG